MAEVIVDVITFNFEFDGSLSSFTEADRSTLSSNLRTATNCWVPCVLKITYSEASSRLRRLQSGSLQANIAIIIPSGTSTGSNSVADSVTVLASGGADALSSATGQTVASVSAPQVQNGISMILAGFRPRRRLRVS